MFIYNNLTYSEQGGAGNISLYMGVLQKVIEKHCTISAEQLTKFCVTKLTHKHVSTILRCLINVPPAY